MEDDVQFALFRKLAADVEQLKQHWLTRTVPPDTGDSLSYLDSLWREHRRNMTLPYRFSHEHGMSLSMASWLCRNFVLMMTKEMFVTGDNALDSQWQASVLQAVYELLHVRIKNDEETADTVTQSAHATSKRLNKIRRSLAWIDTVVCPEAMDAPALQVSMAHDGIQPPFTLSPVACGWIERTYVEATFRIQIATMLAAA